MNLGNLKSITIASDGGATTTEPSYTAAWIDHETNRDIDGDNVGALSAATAVTVVAAPPNGTLSREVKAIRVFNRDTVSHVVTVATVNNGTSYTIAKATLGANEAYEYDGATWTEITAASAPNVGAKNGTTVSVSETSYGPLHQTILTCTATPVTISDDAGVAQYGGVKVYTMPEGLVATMGAVVSGSITAGVTGTIIDNWDGDVALGTVTAATGATLVSTEANIMPSVAVSAGAADKIGVVSAVSVATALTESGATWLDGTTTAVPVFLNFVIDDDATHTAGTATFTGTITLTWVHLGDK